MSGKRDRNASTDQGAKRTDVDSKLGFLPRSHVEAKNNVEFGDEKDIGPFEDPFGDVIEDEEVDGNGDEDGDEEEGRDEDMEDVEPKKVFRPGIDRVEDGEELDYDPTAYDMLHRATVEWPCLSFDILQDTLGAARKKFPHTAYVVAGTQADEHDRNRIYVMKWHKLHKTKHDGIDEEDREDESDDEDEDEEGTDDDAILDFRVIAHPGGVNRIRSMKQLPFVVATWADTGRVQVWDLQAHLERLDKQGAPPNPKVDPIYTFEGHSGEGFAMDFNPSVTGKFVTGDCKRFIYLHNPSEGGWTPDDTPFSEHKKSVEDVQWKKEGEGTGDVFASCSVDRSVRFWDVRRKKKSVLKIEDAHPADVNVLSWHPLDGKLLLTGGDEGAFKVFDVRNLEAGAMAHFKWHNAPITSVDWHPADEAALAVSAADGMVSLWDLSVEEDDEVLAGQAKPEGAEHYPPQLLFLHQGQTDVKEVKWHQLIPGCVVSTALDGFNIFKPSNL
uniref:Uncharacterized protein n=1 Tax=Chromera velia CCMP2878 TaxID=1169474 RepID=A0A0G4HHA3_9ALVE|eukprot:Cvel_6791.t1-p1 / transcript=Cvel_6791.t1 / gene=Cvel_6791 / organism=Chromera_velia_CCMP2878 / gene_product=Glutamate-rich WD repeat-containing protein 1, putative / transcript_product=Glutamate-rich WD repeat-containing protein 1, putative / location=Cvel_scaffold341:50931-57422(-) / protein_length=498 / sequence_SO=supercontig / SO=protein_coding / is_pseudo=false